MVAKYRTLFTAHLAASHATKMSNCGTLHWSGQQAPGEQEYQSFKFSFTFGRL